jgi:hypothetical protein
MARKVIDIGTVGNDGTGDSIRDSFRKVNDNFRELYSSLGLGEKLTFKNLDDTPDSYVGQNDPDTGATPLVTINNTESGLTFKQLIAGSGIALDFTSNTNEIAISAEFSEISADPNPQLGGDLSATSGGQQWRIKDLTTPITSDEAVNKNYADSKISRAGVNAIDPATNQPNSAFGRMTGPLILARDPEPEDDEVYDGLVAATKRYVDNSAFGSVANLYVATSGSDERPGVSSTLQGRALAYAYRSIEAALKKAEELVNESRVELGPYKKLLTFNNGAGVCTLTDVTTSPDSGTGFDADALMSVDTVVLNNIGINYNVGDIITLSGGTVSVGGEPARLEVLTTATTPGAILTFRIISSGVYTAIPGATNVATVTDSTFGQNATFDITYKVNNVQINNGGSGYSLVSVRVEGGGGTGAFGTADVVGGVIAGITITDQGGGFTSIPAVIADLPRFSIRTDNYRTDFTGDVLTDTPEAFRGRDIREGLYLRGETSGALAQILAHSGELDTDGNEIFDVDIQYGSFVNGEAIAYGDVSKNIQISILIESGIYEENLPLKVPQNVAICGDEFRRCIIRPKVGPSSSPWAFQKFRRDLVIDGLTVADREFGYHYLTDSAAPVYPKINNKGYYRAAAQLLSLNKNFIANEVIGWIDNQISSNTAPFTSSFVYDSELCKRDVGLIVDAIIFDLRYGSYNRTISAGLKYYQNASGRVAITTQLSQTLAGITRINALAQQVILNAEVASPFQTLYPQVLDRAYITETGADAVITSLINAISDVIDGSGSVNYPKDNDAMDVFLCNDAVIIRAITCQGHGGFMMVLDPAGQILAKSPYAQECASFAKSIDAQTFTGGQFVDGFAGNLQFKISNKVSNTRLEVEGLDRIPNLPCSFIYLDTVYRLNYVRDFTYNPNGSTATFVLDETTPWTYNIFEYNSAACSRDVGLIIDGVGYEMVLGTNYHSRKAGFTYRQANAELVIETQKDLTVRAIAYAHQLASAEITGYAAQQAVVNTSSNTIVDIINRGEVYAPALVLTNPPGLSTNLANAKSLLLANIEFIKDETIGWISAQVAGNIAPFTTSFVYDSLTCSRDVGYIIEATAYDLIYGGNSQTRDAGLKYYDGTLNAETLQITGQVAQTAAAVAYTKYLIKQVIQNLAPAVSYSSTPRVTSTGATSTEAATVETLISAITTIINGGVVAAPSQVLPDLNSYVYNTSAKTARTALLAGKTDIQTETIAFVDTNANLYELLMPGNRSMLANDFTQINDLGYGIIAHNGGLIEAVSMFTYYNHISYYSLNGGQIRSVGGSSAHGNYALVAEGSDPLEVPTPCSLYYDMSQRVDSYYPSPAYANTTGGLFIFVSNYEYTPLNNSELEVDHGNGLIYRYPVTSVTTTDLPAGVARLNLTSDSTGNFDGIYASVADGAKMSLRANSQIILTGGLVNVAVRPSTGLKLFESFGEVYRVLQFETYTDPNAPYGIVISQGTPGTFRVTATVTTIASNVCTTSKNHELRIGDKFIPTSTANGFSTGVTYYVIDVVNYNQFKVSTTPGGTSATLTNGTGLTIVGYKSHKLQNGFEVSLATSGTLPSPLTSADTYWVVADGLTDTSFRLSLDRNGQSIAVTSAGSGSHTYSPEGLTKTTLRENYNFVDLTLYQPGEYSSDYPTGRAATISVGSPATITLASHGFAIGDVVKFTTSGSLPVGIALNKHYHIITAGFAAGSFRISETPEGTAVDTSGSPSGTHKVGEVSGRVGDSSFAVTPVSPLDAGRVAGTKFVFKGEEYTIITYESEVDLNLSYGRVTLNRALEDSIQATASSYTVKAGVPIRTPGAEGDLTIRISLTRVTSHDLLEIGTGSYADTNYPNEIYGPSVNPLNEDSEVEERDVGRVFYVTTDQFGNFSVGPYFRVDQGTGRVTFSAAIALSNLDGIGFKRGVPIAEFSTDSGMSDNATDTVPTENATRIYIERRLGLTHSGSPVLDAQLIPAVTGGFMALDGQLSMKNNMDLDNHKIINLSNPVNPQDAVNLRSMTFANFQEFTITNLKANDVLTFTGDGNAAINTSIVGDISLNIDSTAHTLDAQINPGVIINADVNATADIAQSKLLMTLASSRAAAPTGTAAQKQALSGLASFDTAQMTVTDGFVTVKDNGLTKSKIEQIASKKVLANSTLTTANVAEVDFSTVVSDGGAIKKNQYGSTGFLRRTNSSSSTNDGDYAIVEMASGSSVTVEASKLIVRNADGDFGGRFIDVQKLSVDTKVAVDTGTSATGGYIQHYTYGGSGGILLADGSLGSDKRNYYDNDGHVFRTQNGLANAPITASSIQVGSITTGGNTTAGTITGRWTLTGSSPNESRLQATYSADLAEYYEGDKEYDVGTVLIFGGDKEVTTTGTLGDNRVAGVVSNTAAFVMYDACPGFKNLVALQGRVPCRVVGKIKKGEMLVTSRIPGVAVAAGADVKVGTVVGKALETYDSDHIGTIEIAVGRT